jgi:carbon-monoxide dehydrogenase small subunit
MDAVKAIDFTLNGSLCRVDVNAHETLAFVLRERLGLTGTKMGCEQGECGACTVLMDGKAVYSCLVLAPEADGTDVVTIEGLAASGELDPIQQAFIDEGAVQCGFCTPGMILSAKGLLDENPDPGDEEIQAALAGNLCRCTGYRSILRAVRRAAAAIRENGREKSARADVEEKHG